MPAKYALFLRENFVGGKSEACEESRQLWGVRHESMRVGVCGTLLSCVCLLLSLTCLSPLSLPLPPSIPSRSKLKELDRSFYFVLSIIFLYEIHKVSSSFFIFLLRKKNKKTFLVIKVVIFDSFFVQSKLATHEKSS